MDKYSYSLLLRTEALIICAFLFLGMIGAFLLGRWTKWHIKTDVDGPRSGVDLIQSSLLGLFAFILGFTFSMSGSRYDYIRNVFIEETNTIKTAFLRSDLYKDSVSKVFRSYFREYLEARIDLYQDLNDKEEIKKRRDSMDDAFVKLWKLASDQSKLPNMLIPSNQMFPALNNMSDSASKREILLRTSIPDIIVYMLLVLALAGSFIAGLTTHAMGVKDWIVIICYATFSSLVIYTTLDMSRPIRGLIRSNDGKPVMLELRKMFDQQ